MRINLFGGPDAGKSTTAGDIFSRLKRMRISVEYVNEYVKAWAYQQRPVGFWDQVYIGGKQMQYEYRFLKNGVKNIVTDSPVALSYIYSPARLKSIMRQLSDEYDKDFAHFNIFLSRGDKPYDPHGRWQTHKEAIRIDEVIMNEVPDLHIVKWDDIDSIMQLAMENVKR